MPPCSFENNLQLEVQQLVIKQLSEKRTRLREMNAKLLDSLYKLNDTRRFGDEALQDTETVDETETTAEGGETKNKVLQKKTVKLTEKSRPHSSDHTCWKSLWLADFRELLLSVLLEAHMIILSGFDLLTKNWVQLGTLQSKPPNNMFTGY